MNTRLATGLAILTVCGACVPSVSGVARKASSAATDEAVEEATDQESRRRLAALVQDPHVQAATDEMIQQGVHSFLRALRSEPARSEMNAIAHDLTTTVADQLMTALASPRAQKGVQALSGTFARTVWAQTATSLRSDLGPALGEVVRDDVAPSMQAALDGPMNQALGATAQRVAYSAVLGANDGLGTALGSTRLGSDMDSWADTGMTWLRAALVALGLFVLMLASLAAIAIAKTRRARMEVQRLESATLLLATAMSQREPSGDMNELVEIVRSSLSDSAAQHKRRGLLGALSLRHH